MSHKKGYVDSQLLHKLAEVLKKTKLRSYEMMQLQPHYKVLDVGCGPGSDTIPLSKLIGLGGEVIGVDNDDAMIVEANQKAVQEGVNERVKHVQADASSLPFVNDYFDSCRCERLFQHLLYSEPAFSEMVRVTKKNGWIVVLDTDWGTFSIDTPEIDIERRLVRLLAERLLNNGYSGRQLYRLFKKHKLENVSIEVLPTHITSYNLLRQIALLDRVEEEALKENVITEDELERWHSSLERADNSGLCFSSGSLIMAAGRKA